MFECTAMLLVTKQGHSDRWLFLVANSQELSADNDLIFQLPSQGQ
jgi:hypothetical protein